jgi:hypothetical protein
MKTLLFVLLLLVVGGVMWVIAKRRGGLPTAGPSMWPFYVRKPLTQPQQVLYHRLVHALPGHIILAQVQVSRVLGVNKGANFHEWNNRINRLSYDFVVCGKDSAVFAAIELDDNTAESAARRSGTDEKKNKASLDAGLRLIRWNTRTLPDMAEIQKELAPPAQIGAPQEMSGRSSMGKSAA